MNHKDKFKWTVKHEQEQKLLINLNNRTVNHFDASKNNKISKDVSKDGLGTVLLQTGAQGWKLVAYASRTMMQSECRYAQIEKAYLGQVFGFETFHGCVHG